MYWLCVDVAAVSRADGLRSSCPSCPSLLPGAAAAAAIKGFVVLGKGEEGSKALQHVLTGMLIFFLRSAVAMTPFELLSCFARDCTQVFDYPRSEFMQYLLSYSTFMTEDTATSTVAQCHCGSKVLCIESPTMSEALVSQCSTCQTSDQERQRARGEQLNE
ncbi:hypothetical protein PF010_g31324 [Phytophthora fragariae]|uniref:Uncharacterized protein n=1 Tax=Phytophthora fragariae TaxID=53985 RepID=A0A6G0JHV9_9STRA|nr:hypothetical protein PF010_g31324 [Phytophthora fragariae]